LCAGTALGILWLLEQKTKKHCFFAGPARKEWLVCFALFFLVTEL